MSKPKVKLPFSVHHGVVSFLRKKGVLQTSGMLAVNKVAKLIVEVDPWYRNFHAAGEIVQRFYANNVDEILPLTAVRMVQRKALKHTKRSVTGAEPKAKATATVQCVSSKDRKPRCPTDSFYDSPEWQRLRYRALKAYGAACQCCGATRKDGVKIHVDHIKPRSKHPELELEFTNMQVLCEPCNFGKSNIDATDWRDQPNEVAERSGLV